MHIWNVGLPAALRTAALQEKPTIFFELGACFRPLAFISVGNTKTGGSRSQLAHAQFRQLCDGALGLLRFKSKPTIFLELVPSFLPLAFISAGNTKTGGSDSQLAHVQF